MHAPPGFGLKPKKNGTLISTDQCAMGPVEDASGFTEEILHQLPAPPAGSKPSSRPATPPAMHLDRGDHGPRAGRRKEQGRGEDVAKQAAKTPLGPDGSKGFKYGRGKPMPRQAAVTLGSIVGAGHSDTDVSSLREEVAGAKMEIGRLQQELFVAKVEAQRLKSQFEGGGGGHDGAEGRQVAAAKAELSEAHSEIQQLKSKLQGVTATAEEGKLRMETIEGENAVLEESLAASKGAAERVRELERLLQERSKEAVVLGSSADGGMVGEKRSGLAAVLADLGFKNPEQAAAGEWQKQPTELQIRCQEAEGVANMLMRELQEARAQTAAMGERLQQRMGPRGHYPNNHMLQQPSHFRPDAPWDPPRGPPMPPMYRGQTPPNHTWPPPSSGPSHFSPFREIPHDRPTAPPLSPGEGIHRHFGEPTGMPNEWQAGANGENEDGSMQQGGGIRGGPERFLRATGGGGRMPPQGSHGGAQVQKATGGEQDLGSLIRDLQQRYGNDGSVGAGTCHSSSLIPSSVIMSAQGRDELIRPAAAPAPLSKPGSTEGGGGDEAWADEVIMYRGFSS